SSGNHHVLANPYRVSAVVPTLTSGSTVVATRANVHYVVMAYGIAHFFGKTLRQHAHALAQISGQFIP
ncbi:4-hydroxybutyrate coenzyme A transferase, partial [Taenia solium]